MISQAVEDHYILYMGEPDRNAQFVIGGHSAEVFKWEPSEATHGVTLYATIGGSQNSESSSLQHRNEIFTRFLPEEDRCANTVAMLALDGLMHGSTLVHGSTVTYPEPLWPGTDMHTYLVLESSSTTIPVLLLPGNVHVEFLQAVPVHRAELEYKTKHGVDQLLQAWHDFGEDFHNPSRPAGRLPRDG